MNKNKKAIWKWIRADFYFAENYEHCYELLLQEKGSFLKQ